MTGTDEIVAGQQDFSAACKEESEDPGGLYRAWWSTLASRVPEDSAIGIEQFVGRTCDLVRRGRLADSRNHTATATTTC